jgi:lysophospholipase L1-like esterase
MNRPLSVVVLGNSVSVLSVPQASPPTEGTYGWLLRDLLYERGVPADVHLESRLWGFLVDALREYQYVVRPHLPDVVVVQFGVNELQPWLLPVSLVRHLQEDSLRADGRLRRWYRRRVVPRVWPVVRGLRRWAAPRVGMHTWQTRPGRFAEGMRQLIRAIRYEFGALVLVTDIAPPGSRLEYWLPGLQPRFEVYQQVLRDVVATVGHPDVRLVRMHQHVRDKLGDATTPDSLHFGPDGHRLAAELLADEIAAWARTAR